jgi:hypothetical protein
MLRRVTAEGGVQWLSGNFQSEGMGLATAQKNAVNSPRAVVMNRSRIGTGVPPNCSDFRVSPAHFSTRRNGRILKSCVVPAGFPNSAVSKNFQK